jgi:Acetyltransferase (GNAT) domain
MRVERYTADREEEWNDFVDRSKNGTFLFDRRYMDYHADRFVDASLLFYDDRSRLVAILPASRHGKTVVSHGGLTYGGLVTGTTMTTTRMLDVFQAFIGQLRGDQVDRVVYKCVPHIYHSAPAEEDAYALFVHHASLTRRDVSSAIDTREPLPPRAGRVQALQQARRAGVRVERTDAFDAFWPVLERNLSERHAARPVHTLKEISMLAARFPENILLFTCAADDDILAGTVLYLSKNVCHVQYNGASADGRKLGGLDLVLAHVIERFSSRVRWVDFGISTQRDGRVLNEGLVNYKEGFGARALTYDFYELRIA